MADKKNDKDLHREAQDFQGILNRLQEITTEVEAKDTALETSMDLLNEAVELGTRATQIIDDENLSEEEKQKLQEMLSDEEVSAELNDNVEALGAEKINVAVDGSANEDNPDKNIDAGERPVSENGDVMASATSEA